MRPKLSLKDKGQMSKSNECTHTIESNLTCIFFSVSAKFKKNILPSGTVYECLNPKRRDFVDAQTFFAWDLHF